MLTVVCVLFCFVFIDVNMLAVVFIYSVKVVDYVVDYVVVVKPSLDC